MLSDACFTFLDDFERAAQKLAETVHWYSSPDFEHVYGEELDALRGACVQVRNDPQNIEALANLLRLATSVVRYHDTPPSTDQSATREAHMLALVRLLREDEKVGDLDDPERLVSDLRRDDAAGEKAASMIAVVLKRLASSTYDVAVKIITDVGSATVKKVLGL